MRMKLYSAPSREEALALISKEMGADAIILSEHEADVGYEIRAAVERGNSIVAPNFATKKIEATKIQTSHYRERLIDILTWHGAPKGFAEMIANSGSRLAGAPTDPAAGFSSALEGVVGFAPITPAIEKPIMLVGPPGGGKTSVSAKLVRRAAAAGATAIPFVGDFDAAAGDKLLAAYLQVAGKDVQSFPDPSSLMAAVQKAENNGSGIVIDTPSINPLQKEDLSLLNDLINLFDAEPVLVISAEGHPLDLEESMKAFADLAITRCIITKLDVVRRRGGVLFAAASARMNLSHLALTPFIGGGLIPATPNRLARTLLENAPGADTLKGAA